MILSTILVTIASVIFFCNLKFNTRINHISYCYNFRFDRLPLWTGFIIYIQDHVTSFAIVPYVFRDVGIPVGRPAGDSSPPPPYTNLPPVPYTSAYWHDPPGSDLWPGRRVDAAACLAVPYRERHNIHQQKRVHFPAKGIAFSACFRWENELHILVSRYGRNHT